MKIVFATDVYFPLAGGLEISIRRMANELIKKGNEVFVVAPSKTSKNKIYQDGLITVFGLGSYLTPINNHFRYSPSLLSKRKIFRLLKQINPDIIHIETNGGIAKSASKYAQKHNIATVATGHFMVEDLVSNLKIPFFLVKIAEYISWRLTRTIWRQVNILTAPTQTATKYFVERSQINREIVPLSNGIDITKFRLVKKQNINISTIMVVGRLVLPKHVEVVIKSLPKVLKKVSANLVVVGDGPEENSLKELTRHLGVQKNVIFMGRLSEDKINNIYQKADVVVTASEIETQGIVILEALSSGLPVIAANAGASPEIVHDGLNGFLFNSGDSDELSNKIIKILSNKDLARKMGREGLRIAKEHDMSEVVIKMQNLYQKAIAINEIKKREYVERQFFISRSFAVKTVLTLFFVAILFKNAPGGIAKAKNTRFSDKIKNLKVVKDFEKFDQKLKVSLQKHNN